MTVRILGSLSAVDPLAVGDAAERLLGAGIDGLHLDISDGAFVPTFGAGPGLVAALRRRLPAALLDVHLMTERPENLFEELAAAGADRVTFHAEATRYPWRAITLARRAGLARVGVALNPASPIGLLDSCRHGLSFVNLLTTEPDVDGERLLPSSAARLSSLVDYLAGTAPILVDGGVNEANLGELVRLGAAEVVVGRAITRVRDVETAVDRLRAAVR